MIGAGLLMFLGIALLVALPFLHAIRKAIEWRWWTEGIRFGEVAVTCTLPSTELIGVYWKLIGMGVLVMFGFSALGGVLAVLVYGVFATTGSIATTAAHLPVAAIVAYGVWYLAMALTFTVLTRIYLVQRVWQRVVNACLLLNPVAAANVTAAGEAASAIGEGLADGLDFAGF
jgi:hypothetical protein